MRQLIRDHCLAGMDVKEPSLLPNETPNPVNLLRLTLIRLRVAGALLSLCLLACDTVVEVQGIVRGPSGAPMEGVDVTMASPGIPPLVKQSGTDGTFHVVVINADPDKAAVSFRKEGFVIVERKLDGFERWAMDITLIPKAKR